jgi:hypothetical protein
MLGYRPRFWWLRDFYRKFIEGERAKRRRIARETREYLRSVEVPAQLPGGYALVSKCTVAEAHAAATRYRRENDIS